MDSLRKFVVAHKVWSAIIGAFLGLFVLGAISAALDPVDAVDAVPSASVTASVTATPTPTAAPTQPSPSVVEEVPMPDVAGLAVWKAEDALEVAFPDWWATLKVAVTPSFKDGADGSVTGSEPKAGQVVQAGDTIVLEVAYPLMPNVVGKQPAVAIKLLESFGYDVRTTKKVGSPVGAVIAQNPKAGAEALPDDDVVITVAKAPPLTVSQENAIESAESYLRFSAFSRQGLIEQLSSQYGEGFPLADATFAVDHIKVNWNEQAAKSAKSYLKFSSFSCQGLIEQLESPYGEQFTHAQAVYGANQTGLCG